MLHITSLPSKYGIGDLGNSAYKFIDFLVETKQSLWQILPLGPTGYGNSPYSNLSAFAGNELFIDLDDLVNRGLLTNKELAAIQFPSQKVDFKKSKRLKFPLFKQAFKNFQSLNEYTDFDRYVIDNKWWLDDYCAYVVLKEKFGLAAWNDWPEEYKKYHTSNSDKLLENHGDELKFYQFLQFIFEDQWFKLKQYANDNGVLIIGDIPIYVAYDSADTWANQEMFELNEDGEMIYISGVPPDHFSDTGQRWGNPIFKWDHLENQGFDWWIKRIERTLNLSDIIRIDHFRGFEDYWRIPASEETAVNGIWIDGPSTKFFDVLKEKLGNIPIIAEDLGGLTKAVYELRDRFDLPGMKILQYAFNPQRDETNYFLPHNHVVNCVVYTGTHDNDTILGWYNVIDEGTKNHFLDYTQGNEEEPNWILISLALMSVANTAIITMQDLLVLGTDARMNHPGTVSDNWVWRYSENQLDTIDKAKLKSLTMLYGRK